MEGETVDPSGTLDEDTRLFFEQSPLPQAFTDFDGNFTEVNRTLTQLLGHDRDWFPGREVFSVMHPLDDPTLRGELDRLRNGDTDTISVEVIAVHSEGRSLQLLVDAALIREPDGTPRHIALVAHDLTALRSAEERLAGQERLYRALSNRAADAALVTDSDQLMIFASPKLTEMLGHTPANVLGTAVTELVHPEERSAVQRVIATATEEANGTDRCVARMRVAGDGWCWVEMTVINSLGDPDIGGLVVNLRDINAGREAEQALRESEARYRTIVETAQEGIAAIDASGNVGLVNDRLTDILGMSLDELHTSARARALIEHARQTVKGDAVVREQVSYDHPDGSQRTLSVSCSALPNGTSTGVLMMVSDITAAHMLQEKLQHQALHDQLTGLPNRYLFEDRLEMAAARQGRQKGGSTAVMYLDLDRFKPVNDTYGHAVGDQLLTEVGRRLVRVVRTSDTVARLGGDEFAIICEGLDEDGARQVAARIQSEVFTDLGHDGKSFEVNASIGIAMFPPHEPARALSLADTAMYQAKRFGGGEVIMFGTDDQPL